MFKYTFENWWNGDVMLVYASTVRNKGEEIISVDWFEFSDTDVQKIKSKQNSIFKGKVRKLLGNQTKEFTKRYKKSEMKDILLLDEIRQCKDIMFGKIPNVNIVFLRYWEIGVEYTYLSDVQRYIKRTIKKGLDDGLGYIHSPNSKFEDKSKPDSRIYARFIWEYYGWIKNFALNENSKSESVLDSDSNNRIIKEQSKLYFKVGILFANGEMDRLIEKHKKDRMANYTAIAKELGNKSFRPYISESISGANKNNKNIFSNNTKLKLIKTYCESNGITVLDSFINRIVED